MKYLVKMPDLYWFLDGGYEEAERKILFMKHEDLSGIPTDPLIEALSIRSTSKFHSLSHRDYLGAILSLGLKREKNWRSYCYGRSGYCFCI